MRQLLKILNSSIDFVKDESLSLSKTETMLLLKLSITDSLDSSGRNRTRHFTKHSYITDPSNMHEIRKCLKTLQDAILSSEFTYNISNFEIVVFVDDGKTSGITDPQLKLLLPV